MTEHLVWGVRHRTVDRSQLRKIRIRAPTMMIVREKKLGDMGEHNLGSCHRGSRHMSGWDCVAWQREWPVPSY